jgi:hypothetical protein
MNFDLILYGKDEFYPNINNKKYQILKVIKPETQKYMAKIFNEFIDNRRKNPTENHYIAIDFEFNKISKGEREVALMQINLENNSEIAHIFIIYPPILLKDIYHNLIRLLTVPEIIKVFHGAESLDIPYLFNQLLVTPENIENFCINFYDTKYLCDYKNITEKSRNLNYEKKSCSIYNFLLDNKVMSKEKFDELEQMGEKMGPIYLIEIKIETMSDDMFKYSLYDVIYLPELIKKFLNLGEIYKNIIPEISCIVNKYKRNIELDFLELEKIVNINNIYYIELGGKNIILKDLWEVFFYVFGDENNYILHLSDINYFRNFIETITKYFVYNVLYKLYDIYKSKKEKGNPISDKYLKWLRQYPVLNKLLIEYNKRMYDEIKKLN